MSKAEVIINFLENNDLSHRNKVVWINDLIEADFYFRVNAISDDEKYCKYCGNKLTFKVETDINSGKECVNDLCKNNEQRRRI